MYLYFFSAGFWSFLFFSALWLVFNIKNGGENQTGTDNHRQTHHLAEQQKREDGCKQSLHRQNQGCTVGCCVLLCKGLQEISPCLEVSTMKLSDEFNLPTDESPCFSGLFFFEII